MSFSLEIFLRRLLKTCYDYIESTNLSRHDVIVLEYMAGGDLSDIIYKGRCEGNRNNAMNNSKPLYTYNINAVFFWLRQAADGLNYMHNKNGLKCNIQVPGAMTITLV